MFIMGKLLSSVLQRGHTFEYMGTCGRSRWDSKSDNKVRDKEDANEFMGLFVIYVFCVFCVCILSINIHWFVVILFTQ